jgi:hypothetical protein
MVDMIRKIPGMKFLSFFQKIPDMNFFRFFRRLRRCVFDLCSTIIFKCCRRL